MLHAHVTPSTSRVARSMTQTALLFVAVMSSGILAGFFLTYAFTIMPGLGTTDDRVFVEAFQGLERMFGTFEYGVNWPVIFGYLFGPAMMAVAFVMHRNCGPIRWWIGGAFALTIATIVITQIFNVPLNDAITAAGIRSTTEATRVRTEFREGWWRAWNLARSATAAGAFVCLSRALLLRGRATAS